MDGAAYPLVREQLLVRRRRLESVAAGTAPPAHLLRLLTEVDSALDRMEKGTFGLCDTCHDPIEPDRLLADPLVCVCLDHLNEPQRRELEQDLELASRIQSGLLPRNDVRRGGWEIGYHYEPAGAVSGDYCDVVTPAGTEDLYFFVGDVSGKGVAASLLMSHLHAIVRTLLTVGTALPQVIERASHMFCENTPSSLYATLACGHARPSGEVDLANAGHCRPVLVRSGRCSAIEAAGLPLGLFCDSRYETTTFRLEPGDSLLLYTDGLIEALNPSGQEYGLERLSTVAAKRRARSARELASACVDDWRAFLAGTRKQDDLTVLAVQRSMAEPRA